MEINFRTGELREIKWPENKSGIEKVLAMKGKSKNYWAKIPIEMLYNMLVSVDILVSIKQQQEKLQKEKLERRKK